MDQPQLFYEDINDALGATIQALGGFKKVAGRLWPSMKLESAYARLKNCLRDDKDEKLSPGELLLLMQWGRTERCHAIMDFLADEAHYERPSPRSPDDEYQQLQREFISAARTLEKIQERMGRVSGRRFESHRNVA